MGFFSKLSFSKFLQVFALILALSSLTTLTALVRQRIRFQKMARVLASDISSKKPEELYVPGELIVVLDQKTKFKLKDSNVNKKTFGNGAVGYAEFDEVSVPDAIKEFDKEYKIKKIDKLAREYDEPKEFLDNYKNKFKKEIETGRKKINEEDALQNDITNIYSLSFDSAKDVKVAADFIKSKKGVVDAVPNYLLQAHQFIPNDTYFDKQWALNNTGQGGGREDADIDAPEAWEMSVGSGEVVIGVLDTGVDYNHPDLGGCIGSECKVIGGYDFYNEDSDPLDDHGHGTHVAGIAAGIANNGLGIAGVCPECKVMALKVLDAFGSGSTYGILRAVEYAVDNGVDIINMSLGCDEPYCGYSTWQENFYAWAKSYGVTSVASAGNSGGEIKSYPATYNNVISVAATGFSDTKAYYSSYGEWVDISAPGGERLDSAQCTEQSILSLGADGEIWEYYSYAYPQCRVVDEFGNKYIALQGTSMSSPMAAGVLGLLLSDNSSLTPDELRSIVLSKSDDIGNLNRDYVGKIGRGRVNARRSLGGGDVCEFISDWGTQGSGDGQFLNPSAVLTTSSGMRVFVADSDNHNVQKFDDRGNLLAKWGARGPEDGQFNSPQGIAGSTYIYVADTNNNRIQKFFNDGSFITKWGTRGSGEGQFNQPLGIAISTVGGPSVKYVYVADGKNNRIQKFDDNGNFIAQWGSLGNGEGQFNQPRGVAVDNQGFVYVADAQNNRIQKFDASGNFIKEWGSPGSDNGQFDLPNSIAVTGDSIVYVADTFNQRVQAFTSTGDFVASWGSQGAGDMQFDNPRGVTVNGGIVFVADTDNQKIKKYACSIVPLSLSYRGDANRDGVVDELDYEIFLSNYGKKGTGLGGDFNEDGIVDGIDYSIWVTTYMPALTATPTATGVTIYPIEDSWVDESNPNDNYGSATTLEVNSNPEKIVYMKFDLTQLAGRPINQATLRLKISDGSNDTQNINYTSNLWDESSLDYINKPALGNTMAGFSNSSSGMWKEIDVRGFVASRKGSVASLVISSSGNDELDFYSKETLSDKPYIYIE